MQAIKDIQGERERGDGEREGGREGGREGERERERERERETRYRRMRMRLISLT